MVLTLILLLQAHPPAKISWLLWAVAILFFLLGLTLLIYLMTRGKVTESDDAEEATGHGLLAAVEAKEELPDDSPHSITQEAASIEATVNETMPLFSAADFRRQDAEKPFAGAASSERAFDAPGQPQEVEDAAAAFEPPSSAEEVPPTPPEQTIPVLEPSAFEPAIPDEAGGTQILTSQWAEPSTVEDATIPFIAQPSEESAAVSGEWQEQATPLQNTADDFSQPIEEDIFSPQEEALLSQTGSLIQDAPATRPDATRELASFTNEPSAARLDAPVSQANFEATARPRREVFEPPTIEPLAPRAQATQTLSSSATVAPDQQADEAPTTTLSSPPAPKAPPVAPVESRVAEPEMPAPADSETLPLSAPTTFKASPRTAPQVAPQWEAQGAGTRSMAHKPAGSVLGLPAEVSDAPLIIGTPSHQPDDGVAALTNYGKDPDAAETGRGGAIALALAILLIGGAVLAYFFIPAVHSYTNNLVARIRGQQPAAAPVEKPRAQIFPSRTPEVNKNLVKVRGAVTNITDEPLEELQVEVTLDRGEGTQAVTRTVPVNPATLAPSQRGVFEIEYEGSKTTGFSRYKVTRLVSKTGDVKFTMPNP